MPLNEMTDIAEKNNKATVSTNQQTLLGLGGFAPRLPQLWATECFVQSSKTMHCTNACPFFNHSQGLSKMDGAHIISAVLTRLCVYKVQNQHD